MLGKELVIYINFRLLGFIMFIKFKVMNNN
jgi:hypothetical protein